MNYLLIGKMGAGKDTVASMLDATPIAFADELKRAVRTLRAEGPAQAYHYIKKLFKEEPPDLMEALIRFSKYPEDPPKDRRLLQEFGTNYCRKHEGDIWVNAVKNRMEKGENYVLTDCRFPNEMDAFPNFVKVYLTCPLEVRRERLIKRDGKFDEATLSHESEKYVDHMKHRCGVWLGTECNMDELEKLVRAMETTLRQTCQSA